MYEVEIKIELSDKERQEFIDVLKKNGFASKGVTPQNDYYVEAKESPHGGFDLKRFRNEAGKFIYTEKIWEMVDGQPVRKEDQHDVSSAEFEAKIAEFPQALKIVKDREWFAGSYKGRPISLTIDSVAFDHSPAQRYFTEAEIDVPNKEDVTKALELIKDFLKEMLNKPQLIEAPGMFDMAYGKL